MRKNIKNAISDAVDRVFRSELRRLDDLSMSYWEWLDLQEATRPQQVLDVRGSIMVHEMHRSVRRNIAPKMRALHARFEEEIMKCLDDEPVMARVANGVRDPLWRRLIAAHAPMSDVMLFPENDPSHEE